MILLFDIGNTHLHVGLSRGARILRQTNLDTATLLRRARPISALKRFVGRNKITGAVLCSVVPKATVALRRIIAETWGIKAFEVSARTVLGIGVDYPQPGTIGADRLANAVAARHYFGAPSLVVDFGTAVTFDVVNRQGNYVGGIIAPGLAMMTSYLHEKTALLPKITIQDVKGVIGKSTRQAMLIGAVHGYRGLVRELIGQLQVTLKSPQLPVVATGGYARLMAAGLPEITAVKPLLTLEGLRLVREKHHGNV